MSIRAHKITTVTLLCIVTLLAWKWLSHSAQIMNASFVAHQAEGLREIVRTANEGRTGTDSVLNGLEWYIAYYDHRTNELARAGLLRLLQRDRECTVNEAITYLRKHGTNDFGDDPYKWLQKEYVP